MQDALDADGHHAKAVTRATRTGAGELLADVAPSTPAMESGPRSSRSTQRQT